MFHSRALYRWWSFVAVALLLAGCSQSAPAPQPAAGGDTQPAAGQSQPAANTPKRGGVFVRSAGGTSYGGTDPAMGQQGYNVFPIIGEPILRRHSKTWELVPAAIEKWEFSSDGKEITLKVRPGIKFHNKPPIHGRELEAKDIVYSLKSIAGLLYPDLPSVRFPRRSNYEEMIDAVVVDKYTVKVTLTGPSATFMDGLAEYRSVTVIPDGLREAFGSIESLATPDVNRYIAAGPFLFSKFTNTVEAEYTRNPDYYEKAADGQPKPYVDAVRYVWIPDKATENAAFIAGQIDTATFRNNEDRSLIVNQKKDTVVVTYESPSCWYRIAFNLQRKPFDDVRVRKALALVLDPVQAGQEFRGEWDGKPVWRYPGPLPWVFPEAIPQEEIAKLPGYRTDQKATDIAEAKRLLNEAGLGGGFEFELLTMANLMEENAILAQNQIQTALPNVKLNLKIVDNAINQQLAAQGNFDTQYYCYIHEPTGVGMMKTAYHSKGGRNYPRFSDAKMDELLDKAAQEIDLGRRKAIMREAQLRALELMPFVPTFHYATQQAIQPHLRNILFGAATSERVWYKEVWLDK